MKKIFIILFSVLILFCLIIYYNFEKPKTEQAQNKEVVSNSAESQNKESQKTKTATNLTPETATEPTLVKGIMIVNKKHPLPKTYNKGEDIKAREEVNKLIKNGQELGLNISNQTSGFRSYEVQNNLYNNYVTSYGKKEADKFSARPGYSEHQTGLVFDLLDNEGQLLGAEGTTKTSKEAAKWLAENAHKYGFIVRYKENFVEKTGYSAEPWHIRYVGNEVAKEIFDQNISLEDYLDVEGGNYNN